MTEPILSSIYESKITGVNTKDRIYSKIHPEMSIKFTENTPVYLLNSIIRTIQSKIHSLAFDFDPTASTTDVEIDYTNTTPNIDKLEHLVRVISMLQIQLSEEELESMIKTAKEESKMDKKQLSESKSDTYEFVIDVDNKDIRYLLTTDDIKVYKNDTLIPDLTKKFFPQQYVLKHLAKNQKIVINMYPSLGTGSVHSRWNIGDGYYDAITKEMNVSPKSSYSSEYLFYKALGSLIQELDVLQSLGEYGKSLEETLKLTAPTSKIFRFYQTTEKNEVIGELFSKFCYEFGKKKRQYGLNSSVYLRPHVGESCIQFQLGFTRKVSAKFVYDFIQTAKTELQGILRNIMTQFVSSNEKYKRLTSY
jgi:hypothetical protein